MIEIAGLTKNYKTVQALKGIDLKIESGELFAYLGPNGAGKTTTIRILTGLTRVSAGKATINGHDIAKDPVAAKSQYGLVPQHINLDSELTVRENLLIHGLLHHMTRDAIDSRIDELLNYIEMNDKRDVFVRKLSGGMKRRVMISRSLLHQPGILFLDEPTVGLIPGSVGVYGRLLKKFNRTG